MKNAPSVFDFGDVIRGGFKAPASGFGILY